MTKLLQDVIERMRHWPEERQDEAAHVLLDLEAQQASRVRLSAEQVREVERIQRSVREGAAVFATDEQMAAFWKKCGL
ncbi:MAG TPA: hypothetical protein VFL51_13270 [Pseudolabrys sp.]|nr:hypothetical protein [Pseudolabrys sp.]